MFKVDFHVHSHFSEDSDTPMDNMVKAAIREDVREICFTEHIDKDYPDKRFTFDLDLEGYGRELAAMKERYEGQIKIHKGVELGVQPHVLDDYKTLLQQEPFDFVICSLHAAKGLDLHNGDFFTGKELDQAYAEYYEEFLRCLGAFDQYSVLGHLDLVTRYRYEEGADLHLEIIEEIFKKIIPEGKGIEVNTSGYYYGLSRALPGREILQLYKDMNGEIITFGSDAHFPSRIAEAFDETMDLLKTIGFRYIATFEEMEPVFHKI